MNFTWREITDEDLKIFNNWHKMAKLKNNEYDGISVFLTDTALLGNFIDRITSSYPERLKAITAILNDVPVGVVVAYIRNEPKMDNIVTFEAIAVNPELTGKGIGTAMIFDVVKNSEKILASLPDYFFASIDKDNKPSRGAFENNGFETDEIEHFDYYSYYLEKQKYIALKDKPNVKFQKFVEETMFAAKLDKNNKNIKKK